MAEGGSLLNCYTGKPVSWVRIPSPPPLRLLDQAKTLPIVFQWVVWEPATVRCYSKLVGNMRKHPWLQMRKGTWYLRAVVPKPLVESMGRREIWRSLKTSERSTADILVQAEAAKVSIEFEQHRKQLRAGPQRVDRAHLEFVVREWAAKLDAEKSNGLPHLIKAEQRSGVAHEVEEATSLLGPVYKVLDA